MTTRKKWPAWRLAALLTLPALQACSTTSGALPPVTPSLPVTPLPAEISQINTSDSQPLLAKARAWVGQLVGLVERRDAQVAALKGQMQVDRQLLATD